MKQSDTPLPTSGFDYDSLELAIADLASGHQATARIIADFLTLNGNRPYVEASATRKYNFAAPGRRGAWIAFWGTSRKGVGASPVLSLDIADPSRLLPVRSSWYEVNETPGQFAKGGWRRLWLTVDDPYVSQVDEIKSVLLRLQLAATKSRPG